MTRAPPPEGRDLEAFFRARWPLLVRALTLLCGDREVAADVAQEALARVAARWPRVSRMEAPEGYCYRIAVNLLKREMRRAHRKARAVDRLRSGESHAAAAADVEGAMALRDAVAALPPRQRLAIVLRYFSDLDTHAAAHAMGCQAGTVRALTSQALQALRARGLPALDPEREVSHE